MRGLLARLRRGARAGLAASLLLAAAPLLAAADVPALFKQHCAECHGQDRLGGMGPALLPENLGRLKKADAATTIRDSRPAVQMPAFRDVLKAEEIQALTDWIYTPVTPTPKWGEAEIKASRVVHVQPGDLKDKPQYKADPLNLFVVVEGGDHHITILDGDRFEPLIRFPSRYALHGGPKFTPDGRYVYFCSRDGWVTKFDMWNLKVVAEVRAGINTRNLAVSGDGRYLMVGNYLPQSLVVLDANDLSPLRILPTVSPEGQSSRVSAVYDLPGRKAFIAAMKDIPYIWEVTYNPGAEPVYEGVVHDFKMGEGIPVPGPFPPRRIRVGGILDDFLTLPGDYEVVGTSREVKGGQVVNLDVKRTVASVDLPGMPHLASGISWEWQGTRVVATPNLKDGVVSVFDTKTWQQVKQIPTAGPGFFMRSHEKTPYAWVDSMMSKDKDVMQLIDKRTLTVAHTLRPQPGKTAAHTEFTRDGKYALVSVWEDDGALVIYDATSLKEVKRLPMRKPVGKYNVWNKITRDEGTSH